MQSKIGVRIIHGCALYTGKYGKDFSVNISIFGSFEPKFKINFRGKREYPGSEVVLVILIPRIISAFKMAGAV